MRDGAVAQPQFGQRLRERRVKLGLSQRALAGDLVTPSYISLLERGERVPTLDVVVWLAQSLECDLADLLGLGAGELLASSAAGLERQLSRLETQALVEAGDLEEARKGLEAKLSGARAADDNGAYLLEYGLSLLPVLAATGRHERRLALLEQLLALPRAAEMGLLSLATDRAATLRELGRLTEAREEVTRLRALGPQRVGEREYVRLLGVLISVLCELDEFDAVDPLVDEALTRAGALKQPGMLGRAHWVAGMAYARMDRPADALAQLDRASQHLSFSSMPLLDWLRFCRSQAGVLLDAGEPAAAERWIAAADTTATMTGLETERMAVDAERGRYELATGHPDRAVEIFGGLVDSSRLAGPDLVKVLLGMGAALDRLGRHEEAVPVLRRAADLLEASGNFRRAIQVWRQIDQSRPAGAGAPGRRGTRRRALAVDN